MTHPTTSRGGVRTAYPLHRAIITSISEAIQEAPLNTEQLLKENEALRNLLSSVYHQRRRNEVIRLSDFWLEEAKSIVESPTPQVAAPMIVLPSLVTAPPAATSPTETDAGTPNPSI